MKKAKFLVQVTSILLTLIFIAVMLPACDLSRRKVNLDGLSDVEISQKLSELSDQYYSESMHQETKFNMTAKGKISGIDATITNTGKTTDTYIDIGKKDFSHFSYEEANTTTEMNSSTSNESYTKTQGFVGGKYRFISYVPENGEATYYKSECTTEQYITHLNNTIERTANYDELKLCKNVTASLDEDKNMWVLHYSGIPDDSEETDKLVGNISQSANIQLELTSIDITINVNASTYAAETMVMKLALVTAADSGYDLSFDYESEATLSIPEKADLTPENFDKYSTDVDLNYLDEFSGRFDEIKYSDGITFKLYFRTAISGSVGSSTIYKEDDILCYGIKDGKFMYNITGETDTSKVLNTFDGEINTIRVNGYKHKSTPMKETAARNYVKSLLKSFNFDYCDVTSIEFSDIDDNGKLTTVHLANNSFAKSTLASIGIDIDSVRSISHQISISTDKNGNFVDASYLLSCNQSSQGKYYNISVTVSLRDVQHGDLSALED